MALDAGKLESALKSALKSALDAEQGVAPDEGDEHRTKFCNAVANVLGIFYCSPFNFYTS